MASSPGPLSPLRNVENATDPVCGQGREGAKRHYHRQCVQLSPKISYFSCDLRCNKSYTSVLLCICHDAGKKRLATIPESPGANQAPSAPRLAWAATGKENISDGDFAGLSM